MAANDRSENLFLDDVACTEAHGRPQFSQKIQPADMAKEL
ncbi:hypothetical protein AGROH133_14450 (plasmid) [Agrobacterium tumefaciens]|nr:hypothetical protein AGROH133_14450 [Agrobacterium tumefaciens]